MFRNYLSKFFRIKTLYSDFPFCCEGRQCFGLIVVCNFRNDEINCPDIIRKLTQRFEQTDGMQVNEDICIVDDYLH